MLTRPRILVVLSFVLLAAVVPRLDVAQAATANRGGNGKVNLYQGGTGGPCSGEDLAVKTGFINFHRNGDSISVNVHIKSGVPNTTYEVFVRCVGSLGTIQTDDDGVGNGNFTAAWSPGFSIDMHEFTTPDYMSSGPFPS